MKETIQIARAGAVVRNRSGVSCRSERFYPLVRFTSGADDGIRTRDPNLGKVVLYQLSHVRVPNQDSNRAGAVRGEASDDRHDGR